MEGLPNIAVVGALIGDPVRAMIVSALMDGSARPAGELAALCGVTPQTASSHLARLVEGGLLDVIKQGRNRYYRLRNADVAHAIESLQVAVDVFKDARRHIEPKLKLARRCYDHIAGELGVIICDRLIERGHVVAGSDGYGLSESGRTWLKAHGIDPSPRTKRVLVRPCLDWTERRSHLAGFVGASLCRHFEDQGYVRRGANSRALEVTPPGRRFLKDALAIDLWQARQTGN